MCSITCLFICLYDSNEKLLSFRYELDGNYNSYVCLRDRLILTTNQGAPVGTPNLPFKTCLSNTRLKTYGLKPES